MEHGALRLLQRKTTKAESGGGGGGGGGGGERRWLYFRVESGPKAGGVSGPKAATPGLSRGTWFFGNTAALRSNEGEHVSARSASTAQGAPLQAVEGWQVWYQRCSGGWLA